MLRAVHKHLIPAKVSRIPDVVLLPSTETVSGGRGGVCIADESLCSVFHDERRVQHHVLFIRMDFDWRHQCFCQKKIPVLSFVAVAVKAFLSPLLSRGGRGGIAAGVCPSRLRAQTGTNDQFMVTGG